MPKNVAKKIIHRFETIYKSFAKEDEVIKTSLPELVKVCEFKNFLKAKEWLRYSNAKGYINNLEIGKDKSVSFVINWDALGVLKPVTNENKLLTDENKANQNSQHSETLHKTSENKKVLSHETRLLKNTEVTEIETEKEGVNIYLFRNELYQIKAIDINGEIYFIAEEVGKILGYSNYREAVRRHVDKEDTIKFRNPETGKEKLGINESGLYSLIFGSHLPEAKRFKRWVTKEVLPSIRKTGLYLSPKKVREIIQNPSAFIELLQGMLDHIKREVELVNQCKSVEPYVEFAKQIEKSDNSISVEEWAKSISKKENIIIGRNTAFRWLREKGYLTRKNLPYQKWINQGYFDVIPTIITTKEGMIIEQFITRITPKGQIKLTEEIVKDFQNKN